MRDQFLVEIANGIAGVGTVVDSLAELNALFTAWVAEAPDATGSGPRVPRPHGASVPLPVTLVPPSVTPVLRTGPEDRRRQWTFWRPG